jgi:hypothetical protein
VQGDVKGLVAAGKQKSLLTEQGRVWRRGLGGENGACEYCAMFSELFIFGK